MSRRETFEEWKARRAKVKPAAEPTHDEPPTPVALEPLLDDLEAHAIAALAEAEPKRMVVTHVHEDEHGNSIPSGWMVGGNPAAELGLIAVAHLRAAVEAEKKAKRDRSTRRKNRRTGTGGRKSRKPETIATAARLRQEHPDWLESRVRARTARELGLKIRTVHEHLKEQ